jgi:hypothetical protein
MFVSTTPVGLGEAEPQDLDSAHRRLSEFREYRVVDPESDRSAILPTAPATVNLMGGVASREVPLADAANLDNVPPPAIGRRPMSADGTEAVR